MTEQDMLAAPSRQEPPGRRQLAILGFKLGKSFVATVARIDVERDKPGDSAGGDADVTNRPRPESFDHREIGGRIVKSALLQRMVAGAIALLAPVARAAPASRN
jgi:hypothetical protein